ncbi:MAG: hypothetical protein ACI83P_002571 [Janthinobacterium sp.]|jgi:hypothetical protein
MISCATQGAAIGRKNSRTGQDPTESSAAGRTAPRIKIEHSANRSWGQCELGKVRNTDPNKAANQVMDAAASADARA